MSRSSEPPRPPPASPPSPPPRPAEDSAWDEDPDPQLLAPGKTLAEQLLSGSRFLALHGSASGSPDVAAERWPWHYVEATAELVGEMVQASGLPREEVLTLLENEPFDARPTGWPSGLVEYLLSQDPLLIQTLATGLPGLRRPQTEPPNRWIRPHLDPDELTALTRFVFGPRHAETVPWEKEPSQPLPDLEALVACLERLKLNHAHKLGSPAPSGKPVPLAACACYRPLLLEGGPWARDGVSYSALAVSEGTLADAAAAAQRQELLDKVGELWKRVRKSDSAKELLARGRDSDRVQKFLEKRSGALLGPALRLAQAIKEASPPLHERVWDEKTWGKKCCAFLDRLREAGSAGVKAKQLKDEFNRDAAAMLVDMKRCRRNKKKRKLARKITRERDQFGRATYYLKR